MADWRVSNSFAHFPKSRTLRTMWPYSAKLRRVVVASTFCGSIVKCRVSWSTSHNRDLSSLSVQAKRETIEGILGITSGQEIGNYLALFGPRRSLLSLWKARSLSLAGRLCLINYSLMPILFYAFGHCSIPVSVLNWVDLQVRCFVRKLHDVGWSSAFLAKTGRNSQCFKKG